MIGALLSALWRPLSWLLSPMTVAALAVALGLLYRHLTRNFDFWPSRGVPGPPGKLPWGYSRRILPVYELHNMLYTKHGGKRFCGFIDLGAPTLFVGDLDLIRAINIKDFEHFTDHRDFVFSDGHKDMLIAVNGKKWKETRAVMSPTFSASKLKAMHQLCLHNASSLNRYLREEMQSKGEIELKDSFGRFTMDNIASCAFGVNCNSFEDPNTEFAKYAGTFFAPVAGYRLIYILARMLLPKWFSRRFPDPFKTSNAFFKGVVNATIKQRLQETTTRKDFLQLMLDTKDKSGERVLSNDSIVTQSILFFMAGYDTTAMLLTFAGYALATHPDCQRAAQREIDDVLEKHGGRLTYEAVGEMAYLERVLSETLRLYPPLMATERRCSKDYVLPGTDLRLERGTVVHMPILAIHRDPDIYPDPLRFDPDRFLPEAKERRHPCAFRPFGSGPRNCIAMRFALFEAKVALVAVLRENMLAPGPRTPAQEVPIDPSKFIMAPLDGLFIKVLPRS